MLSPVIMIGCGGSGQKAVRYIRDAVRRRLVHAGWEGEFPRSWQFIGLDTLESQESPGEIPTMPASDYKSVSLKYSTYTDLEGTVLSSHRVGVSFGGRCGHRTRGVPRLWEYRIQVVRLMSSLIHRLLIMGKTILSRVIKLHQGTPADVLGYG